MNVGGKTTVKLTFVTKSNLRTGRGTESVLFNLIKKIPEDFQVSIIETDILLKSRLSEEDVKQRTLRCDREIMHIRRIEGNSLKEFFYKYIHKTFRIDISNALKTNVKLSKIISSTDIAFLIFNYYAPLFNGKNCMVIGSEHCGFGISPNIQENGEISKKLGFSSKIKFSILNNFYFKRINAFQYFPRSEEWIKSFIDQKRINLSFSLPNGIDTEIFYPEINKEKESKIDKLKVFFIASLERGKGIETFLYVANKFSNDSRVEFHVAGTGSFLDDVKSNPNVIYEGVPTAEALPALYRSMDIFLYPSTNDTFGLVVLEALSSGLYVLTTMLFKEVFQSINEHCIEYLPARKDSFYEAMQSILDNPELGKVDKASVFEKIKKNFDWEVIRNSFYENLRRINLEFKDQEA